MLCDCYFNAVVSISSRGPPIIFNKVLLDLMTRDSVRLSPRNHQEGQRSCSHFHNTSFYKKKWDNFNTEHFHPVLQKYNYPCVPQSRLWTPNGKYKLTGLEHSRNLLGCFHFYTVQQKDIEDINELFAHVSLVLKSFTILKLFFKHIKD